MFEEFDIGSVVDVPNVESRCTICLQNLSKQDELGIVDCGHVFCFSCISTWTNTASSCCACRERVHSIAAIKVLGFDAAVETQKKLYPFRVRNPKKFVHVKSTSSSSSSTSIALLFKRVHVILQKQRSITDGDELVAAELYFSDLGVDADIHTQSNALEVKDGEYGTSAAAEVCEDCKKPGLLIFCDGCNKCWDLHCVKLERVPDGNWLCFGCEVLSASFSSRAEFIQKKQEEINRARIEKFVHVHDAEEEEDEDDGPIVMTRKRLIHIELNPNVTKRRKVKDNMRGYRDDGFVVPADNDDF